MKVGARDLIMYFAFAALPIATYLLRGVGDTNFYLSLEMMGLVVLLWMRFYYKDSDQLVVYDQNLNPTSLAYIAGGVAAIVLISSFITSSVSKSILYVPMNRLGMSFGQFQLSNFWDDILFQLVLVAPAEELTKLVVHLSFYIWLRQSIGEGIARFVAILAPIGFWAVLHTYRNPAYMGSDMWIMVTAAFLGGIIIFAVTKYTKSLLAGILTHFAYNSIIVYASYYGLSMTGGFVLLINALRFVR